MTPQLIQWEQLQIQKILSNRWNGAYPHYMAGNQAPMLMMGMK